MTKTQRTVYVISGITVILCSGKCSIDPFGLTAARTVVLCGRAEKVLSRKADRPGRRHRCISSSSTIGMSKLLCNLQHAWATAVEAVGIFTKQALKSNIGDGEWLRLFALMSSEIAVMRRLR